MTTKKKTIHASAKDRPLIAMGAAVEITAAAGEGEKKSPPKFSAEFYTGGAMDINGWDLPVVIDLAGLEPSKVLVANLDHDSTKRVGNFAVANDGKSLVANGTATARTAAREEVVGSAEEGYQWQASLEVSPREIEEVKKGHTAEANGRKFDGPLYVTRKGTLKGFAFVSHGADDNTSAKIAAKAVSTKEHKMKTEVKAWVAEMLPSLDIDSLTDEQVANFEADYAGSEGSRKAIKGATPKDGFEKKQAESNRRKQIKALAEAAFENSMDLERYDDVDNIREARDAAIKSGISASDFRYELKIATLMETPVISTNHNPGITERVLEAAVCQAGRLNDKAIEDKFSKYTDQEQQVAHDIYKGRIELRQLLIAAATANGYHSNYSSEVTLEVQAAAFGMSGPRRMQKAGGFSTIDIANVVSNVANKFLYEGWMAVDQTCLQISARRSLKDFKAATTVSLTGDLQYLEVGASGEIPHGTIADLTYTDQVKTYGRMLAITRQDIINDDLGALTAVPKRLGRGAMLKLNDIFWTVWLGGETAGFWAAGNNNINTGVAQMTIGGLTATEIIFMNQTDYDGKPLGIQPSILLVPTNLKSDAISLTDPQSRYITGTDITKSDSNPFRGRFTVLSTPYMSNSTYTGYSTIEWYMMADPSVLPSVTIAALNGKVEPTVDTADADFNVLGIQMRGYSDVGVALTEKKASVLADGNAS